MWTHTMNMHNNKLSKILSIYNILRLLPKILFYFKLFSKIFILSKKPLPKTEVLPGSSGYYLK